MRDRILALLGIAQKARAVASGSFLTEQAVAKQTAKLVIIASDASANTRDSLEKITYYYKVPVLVYGTKETLGHAIGQSERSCVALLDAGFASKIRSQYAMENQSEE